MREIFFILCCKNRKKANYSITIKTILLPFTLTSFSSTLSLIDDKIITGGSLLKESLLFTLKLLTGAYEALLFKSGFQKPNTVQVLIHSKMSLAIPECKLTGFLRFLRAHVKLSSNSEFILTKIKPTQSGQFLSVNLLVFYASSGLTSNYPATVNSC